MNTNFHLKLWIYRKMFFFIKRTAVLSEKLTKEDSSKLDPCEMNYTKKKILRTPLSQESNFKNMIFNYKTNLPHPKWPPYHISFDPTAKPPPDSMRKTRGIDWWLLIRHWLGLLAFVNGWSSIKTNYVWFEQIHIGDRIFHANQKPIFLMPQSRGRRGKEPRERTRNGLLNCPSIKSVIKKFINFLRHSGPSVTYTTTRHTLLLLPL